MTFAIACAAFAAGYLVCFFLGPVVKKEFGVIEHRGETFYSSAMYEIKRKVKGSPENKPAK